MRGINAAVVIVGESTPLYFSRRPPINPATPEADDAIGPLDQKIIPLLDSLADGARYSAVRNFNLRNR
jgi:hypothetical protein